MDLTSLIWMRDIRHHEYQTTPSALETYSFDEQAVRIDMQKPTRLLLVDDDREFTQSFKLEAGRRGIEVEVLNSFWGLWGMDLTPFSAVMLDCQLPDVSGIELAALLDDLDSHTPVVLISKKSNWVLDRDEWPRCVREFISKRRGVDEVLDATYRFEPQDSCA